MPFPLKETWSSSMKFETPIFFESSKLWITSESPMVLFMNVQITEFHSSLFSLVRHAAESVDPSTTCGTKSIFTTATATEREQPGPVPAAKRAESFVAESQLVFSLYPATLGNFT